MGKCIKSSIYLFILHLLKIPVFFCNSAVIFYNDVQRKPAGRVAAGPVRLPELITVKTDPVKSVRNARARGQRLAFKFPSGIHFGVQSILTTGDSFYGVFGISPTCLHSAHYCSLDGLLR